MLHGGTDWMTHSGQTSWCELETTWTNQYRPASQKMVCIRTVGARVQILLCCIYLSHKRFFSRWQDYISFSLWIYHLSIYSQWHFAITLKLLHCRWHHHHRTDWVQQWFSVQRGGSASKAMAWQLPLFKNRIYYNSNQHSYLLLNVHYHRSHCTLYCMLRWQPLTILYLKLFE